MKKAEVASSKFHESLRQFLIQTEFPYRNAGVIVVLQIGMTIFEGAGVATLIPLFELIAAGGDPSNLVDESRIWQVTADLFEKLHLPLSVYTLCGTLFGLVLFRQLFKAATQIYYSTVNNRCIRDARVMGFKNALTANIGYHDTHATGDIVNDLITDLERAIGAIFGIIFSIGQLILLGAYGFVIAAITSWSVIGLIIMVTFFGLVLRGIYRRSLHDSEAIANLNRSLSAFMFERLKSVRLILLTGTQQGENRILSKIASDLCDRRISLVQLRVRIPLIIEPLAFIIVMSVMVFSTTVFSMKFEVMIVVLGLLVRLLPVVQELATAGQGIISTWGSLASVNSRFQELQEANEEQGQEAEFKGLDDKIEMRAVAFRYGNGSHERPALNNISVDISAGSLTALVGPSGAGKSTLVDILTKLRERSSGEIRLDGRPIDEFSVYSLRGKIAFVSQEPQIFNQTIAEHIRYGNLDVSDADIRAAAALTGADGFINDLPDGYGTVVGESAVLLSGGQRQRLDLARAVVRHSPMLILDEPASGLDVDSEEHLREAILRIRDETNTTIILIAHGFSMVVDADQIIVMDRGEIVDVGRHEQLLTRSGWYAEAFAKQRRGLQWRPEASVGV